MSHAILIYQSRHAGCVLTGLAVVARDREDDEASAFALCLVGNPAISGLTPRPEALRPHLTVGMLTQCRIYG